MNKILTKQQEQIRKTQQDHGLHFGLGCGGILIAALAAFSSPHEWLLNLYCYLFLFVVIAVTVYYGAQLSQTRKISFAAHRITLENTVARTICVQKIRFVTRVLSRSCTILSCIVLTDDRSQTFYYILPDSAIDERSLRNAYRKRLTGSVKVLCYTNSNVICELLEEFL